MENTQSNRSDQQKEIAPCGRHGECSHCVIRDIIQLNLENLNQQNHRKIFTRIAAELTGIRNPADRFIVSISRQIQTFHQEKEYIKNCPQVAANQLSVHEALQFTSNLLDREGNSSSHSS